MTKILLFLISVGLLWTVGYGIRISGTDFDDDYLDREAEDIDGGEKEKDQNAKMAEACLIQILGPSVSCIMRSLSKWNVNPYQIKADINVKPTCCSIWEMTDCLKNKAHFFCTEEERTAFVTHMNTQTELRNEKNCSLFQYKSTECSADQEMTDDSPVFTKVSLRENNQFLDTNQLEDELIPKKHESGHGKVNPANKFFGGQSGIGTLDELTLAQRLLDRVDRITINHMVIDLHPVGRHDSVPKQELEVEES